MELAKHVLAALLLAALSLQVVAETTVQGGDIAIQGLDRRGSKPKPIPAEALNAPECLCGGVPDPVCGEDGQTYSSACLAECAGLQPGEWRRGECGRKPPSAGVVASASVGDMVSCAHVRLCEHIFEPANGAAGGGLACGWCQVGSEPENGYAVPCAPGTVSCDKVEPCLGAFFDGSTSCNGGGDVATPDSTTQPTTYIPTTAPPSTMPVGTPDSPITSMPTPESTGTPVESSTTSVASPAITPEPTARFNAGLAAAVTPAPSGASANTTKPAQPTQPDAVQTPAANATVVDAPRVLDMWTTARSTVVATAAAYLPNCTDCAVVNASEPLACGSDGLTYHNGCEAKCAGVSVQYAGPCSQQPPSAAESHVQAACLAFCVLVEQAGFPPVCGDDGRTHPSACSAACFGAAAVARQPCECMCSRQSRVVSEAGRLMDVRSGCSLKRSGQDYCFTAGRCLSAGRQMTVFHQLDIGVEADVLSVSSCSVSPTQEPGRSASGSSVAGLEDGGRKALRQP